MLLTVGCRSNTTPRVAATKPCSLGPRPVTSTTAPAPAGQALSTDGPLRSFDPGSNIGAAGWSPFPDFVALRTEVPLENRGTTPIVLDTVVVGPPIRPEDPAPRLLGCYATPNHALDHRAMEWNDHGPRPKLPPAHGFRVPPAGSGFTPDLALLLGANGPKSYTTYVIITYHTLDGHEYAANFGMTWLFCVQGEAPKGCVHSLMNLP